MKEDGLNDRWNCVAFQGGRIATNGNVVRIRGVRNSVNHDLLESYNVDMDIVDFLSMLSGITSLDIVISHQPKNVVVERKELELKNITDHFLSDNTQLTHLIK